MPVFGLSASSGSPLNELRASATAFSMKSSDIRREGCSLKTEFMRAIFAALLRASAFVGQFWKRGEVLRRSGEPVGPYLEAAEAGASREGDVADVGLGVGGHGLIDDEGAVPEVGASGLLHLPEFLERLDDVHWKRDGRITSPHNDWRCVRPEPVFEVLMVQLKAQTKFMPHTQLFAVWVCRRRGRPRPPPTKTSRRPPPPPPPTRNSPL